MTRKERQDLRLLRRLTFARDSINRVLALMVHDSCRKNKAGHVETLTEHLDNAMWTLNEIHEAVDNGKIKLTAGML